MKLHDEAEADNACVPEWVQLNPLLSYCARSVPGPARREQGGPTPAPPAGQCSRHRTCVFGFRKP